MAKDGIPQRYLVRVQYLGFRYSGWQRQPGQKTIEGMLHKTLRYILPGVRFKILGAGRTDAMVSALDAAFELLIYGEPILEPRAFLGLFNQNLPPDIRVLEIEAVASGFNVIRNAKLKEYRYYFSFGKKPHPFSAPFMAYFGEDLNLAKMQKGAKMFEGYHDFSAYTVRKSQGKTVTRQLDKCILKQNTDFKADFFPETSYVLVVCGAGFLRYQIRMIMGCLVQVGQGDRSTDFIRASLEVPSGVQLDYVAPASGLMLQELWFGTGTLGI